MGPMGAVKPAAVKSLARTLLKEFPDRFGDDVEANKRQVALLTTVTSKQVRNRVAGYVTVLRKRLSKEQATA